MTANVQSGSMPIPLVLPMSSFRGKDEQVAGARLINGYAELNANGKSQFALYGVPGLTRWDAANYTGVERGQIVRSDSELIAFLGNQIVSFGVAGNDTLLATIAGSGRLHLAINRAASPEIGVVTEAGQYYVLTGSTLTLNADTDLPSPNSITYLRGRFLYGVASGQVYCSAVDDATSISALGYGEINSSADGLVRVFSHGGYGYFFGTRSLEIWQADPSLAGQPFPYSPAIQDIESGLIAPHSVAKSGQSLIWVDQNCLVRHGQGNEATRASSHSVERAIENLTDIERANMVGFMTVWEGHEVYVLQSARFTMNLDLTIAQKAGLENAWFERKTYDKSHWGVTSSVQFANKYILGDEDSGKLYYLDPSSYSEDGDELIFEAHCPHSHKFPDRLIVDAVEIDAIAGVGLNSSTDAYADPKMMIDFSDDGGKTWKAERQVSIGKIGEYNREIRSNKWGQCKKRGRIWRFRVSAAVLKGISQAAIRLRATS